MGTLFSGYCPEFGEERTVVVDFTEIPILGSTEPGYKKRSLQCDHLEDCRHTGGREINCPLFLQCPDF